MKDQNAVLAGLTCYAMARDETTRVFNPAIPDEPGTIHALRPTLTDRKLLNAHFIEDTGDYRAAICGAKVKVVLPLTFKSEEEDACPECVEELASGAPEPTISYSPLFHAPGGDSWWQKGGLKNPNYRERREHERRRKTGS
ncbi:hypothetical protein [Paenarthrobacter ilicis]|uniref:hypothetical protein n=1 Tax=Paenarthrobacter ilicis TaxID=43665 RepID=UPI00386C224F